MHRPLIMAHMGGKNHGQENSVEAVIAAARYHPDIIELDVRKSRDGILYCHHGSIPFGMFCALFFPFFTFSKISRLTNANILREVLAAIKGNPIIFLDIRERAILPHDLAVALSNFSFSSVWFACRSLPHLKSFRDFFGDRFRYVYNFGFFTLSSTIKQMKKIGVDIFQIFFWQCNEATINMIRKSDLDYAVCSFFQSRTQYEKRAKRWNSLWIYYDNLASTHRSHSLERTPDDHQIHC